MKYFCSTHHSVAYSPLPSVRVKKNDNKFASISDIFIKWRIVSTHKRNNNAATRLYLYICYNSKENIEDKEYSMDQAENSNNYIKLVSADGLEVSRLWRSLF